MSEPYLNLHCKLGEGPYYEAATNSLRFVDIINKRVHTVSLTEGPDSVKTIQLDVPVTVTADVDGVDPQEKILIGVKYGIALLDRNTGTYEYVAKFAAADGKADERLRSNDGAVDPHGRFWLGTMTDFGLGDIQPEGMSIFALSHSSLSPSFVPTISNIVIPAKCPSVAARDPAQIAHRPTRTGRNLDHRRCSVRSCRAQAGST